MIKKFKLYDEKSQDKGSFKLNKDEINKIRKDFKAEKISDSETLRIIKEVYDKEKFIIDPHTATAFGAIKQNWRIKRYSRVRNSSSI